MLVDGSECLDERAHVFHVALDWSRRRAGALWAHTLWSRSAVAPECSQKPDTQISVCRNAHTKNFPVEGHLFIAGCVQLWAMVELEHAYALTRLSDC